MRVVEEIRSADQRNRVLVCEREDGLFTFVEERNAAEPPACRWERSSGGSSLFDSAAAVILYVREGLGWLHREMTWPARDSPPAAATPREGGAIDCPACGVTFFIKDPARWGGGRHLTCGQMIELRGGPFTQ